MLHQVGGLFELNVKLRCQKVNLAPMGPKSCGNIKYSGLSDTNYTDLSSNR